MRPTLLVADADAATRTLVATALGDGYHAIEAEDGERALSYLRGGTPDLVVADLELPKIGGAQLLYEVRRSPAPLAGVPVLVLIASADETLRARLLQSGAQDYVLKPFAPDELRARVENLLAVRQAKSSQRADEEKSAFLHQLSHELRTPLAALHLQLELLARALTDPANEKQAEVLARIARSSSRFTDVVEALSAFVRVESGLLVPKPTRLDLAAVATAVVDELRNRGGKKRVSIRLQVPLDETSLESDPEIVRTIIVRVCDEAIKQSKSGEIVVEVERRADGGARLRVTGLAPAGPMPSREPSRPGMEHPVPVHHRNAVSLGLGILLVKRIAAVLGAVVDVEDGRELGWRLCVTFPPDPRP